MKKYCSLKHCCLSFLLILLQCGPEFNIHLKENDMLSGESILKIVFNVLPPFVKGVYSKRKEFAPLGSKFFLLEWTLYLKWLAVQKQEVTKDASLVNQSTDSTGGSTVSDCRLGKWSRTEIYDYFFKPLTSCNISKHQLLIYLE